MFEFLKKLFAGPPSIDVDDLARLMDAGEIRVLDVREPSEFKTGHVPGAVNISIRRLPENLGKLKKDKPWAVICASGHRSTGGVHILTDGGFEGTVSVRGGTGAWARSGRKLVR